MAGRCISDIAVLADQPALFGPVASDSTAFATNTPTGGPGTALPDLELCNPRRTRAEDRIRCATCFAAHNNHHGPARMKAGVRVIHCGTSRLRRTATRP